MLVFVQRHCNADAHKLGADGGYFVLAVGKGNFINSVGVKPLETDILTLFGILPAAVEHKGKAFFFVVYIAV